MSCVMRISVRTSSGKTMVMDVPSTSKLSTLRDIVQIQEPGTRSQKLTVWFVFKAHTAAGPLGVVQRFCWITIGLCMLPKTWTRVVRSRITMFKTTQFFSSNHYFSAVILSAAIASFHQPSRFPSYSRFYLFRGSHFSMIACVLVFLSWDGGL
jgi:hypothetical protein